MIFLHDVLLLSTRITRGLKSCPSVSPDCSRLKVILASCSRLLAGQPGTALPSIRAQRRRCTARLRNLSRPLCYSSRSVVAAAAVAAMTTASSTAASAAGWTPAAWKHVAAMAPRRASTTPTRALPQGSSATWRRLVRSGTALGPRWVSFEFD